MAPPSSIHTTVPPIFDSIVTPASQSTSNLGPAFAHLGNQLLDQNSLFGCDGLVVKIGFQILVKAFTALLRRPSLDGARDANPVVSAMEIDQM